VNAHTNILLRVVSQYLIVVQQNAIPKMELAWLPRFETNREAMTALRILITKRNPLLVPFFWGDEEDHLHWNAFFRKRNRAKVQAL